MKNYGYKVCYKEQGSKTYVRYFLTYTLNQALKAMYGYIRYPPRERGTGRKLENPQWKIIPVNQKEFSNDIWNELPF